MFFDLPSDQSGLRNFFSPSRISKARWGKKRTRPSSMRASKGKSGFCWPSHERRSISEMVSNMSLSPAGSLNLNGTAKHNASLLSSGISFKGKIEVYGAESGGFTVKGTTEFNAFPQGLDRTHRKDRMSAINVSSIAVEHFSGDHTRRLCIHFRHPPFNKLSPGDLARTSRWEMIG